MPLDDAEAGSTKSQRRFQLFTRKPQGDIQGNKGHMDEWIRKYISEASTEDQRRLELKDKLYDLAKGEIVIQKLL